METVVFFAPDHPASRDHFPGNPIIPGAVLLDEVIQAIALKTHCSCIHYEILAAKFLRPVRPGNQVRICLWLMSDHEIKFDCMESDHLVLTGRVKLEDPAG